jgi:hypothetical protein
MPESGAIERVRRAMEAWTLGKGPPGDVDQLRADLIHILDCTPPTFDVTLPAEIRLHAEHDGDFPGARDELTLRCLRCGWTWRWTYYPPPSDIQATADDHHRRCEVCCVCDSPDVGYHNYKDQPFCIRCANGGSAT